MFAGFTKRGSKPSNCATLEAACATSAGAKFAFLAAAKAMSENGVTCTTGAVSLVLSRLGSKARSEKSAGMSCSSLLTSSRCLVLVPSALTTTAYCPPAAGLNLGRT